MIQYTILISPFLFVHFSEAVKTVEITRDDTDKKLCKLLCKAENALNLEWSASHSENFNSTGSHLTVRKSDLSHSYTCDASNPVSRMTTTVKAKDICKGKGLNSWYTSETQFGRQQSGFGVEYGKEACKPERFILEFNIATEDSGHVYHFYMV